MINAILLDLDGTLCDCTELHYISLNKALHEVSNFEISRKEHELSFNGLPTKQKLDLLILNHKINVSDKQIIWNLKQQYTKQTILETLKFDDDKIDMLKYLRKNNIKVACVTNSIFETAELILKTIGQFEYMDLLISNDMIKYPKPHPEGYIRAMIYFQTMPENTLIVEDSEVGVLAANASAANVWKIKNSHELTLQNTINQLEMYND